MSNGRYDDKSKNILKANFIDKPTSHLKCGDCHCCEIIEDRLPERREKPAGFCRVTIPYWVDYNYYDRFVSIHESAIRCATFLDKAELEKAARFMERKDETAFIGPFCFAESKEKNKNLIGVSLADNEDKTQKAVRLFVLTNKELSDLVMMLGSMLQTKLESEKEQ